jgi:hypothetical protein
MLGIGTSKSRRNSAEQSKQEIAVTIEKIDFSRQEKAYAANSPFLVHPGEYIQVVFSRNNKTSKTNPMLVNPDNVVVINQELKLPITFYINSDGTVDEKLGDMLVQKVTEKSGNPFPIGILTLPLHRYYQTFVEKEKNEPIPCNGNSQSLQMVASVIFTSDEQKQSKSRSKSFFAPFSPQKSSSQGETEEVSTPGSVLSEENSRNGSGSAFLSSPNVHRSSSPQNGSEKRESNSNMMEMKAANARLERENIILKNKLQTSGVERLPALMKQLKDTKDELAWTQKQLIESQNTNRKLKAQNENFSKDKKGDQKLLELENKNLQRSVNDANEANFRLEVENGNLESENKKLQEEVLTLKSERMKTGFWFQCM